jgi:hypothetical protein
LVFLSEGVALREVLLSRQDLEIEQQVLTTLRQGLDMIDVMLYACGLGLVLSL